MKNRILLLFFLWPVVVSAQSSFQKAQATAKAEGKRLLLRFSGSDWCIPCIRMEKAVFEKDSFVHYANEKLVLIQADFPRLKKHRLPKAQQQENEALAEKFNPKGAFPLTVLLNAEGKLIKAWEGEVADSPENFIQQLEAAQRAE